MGTNRNRFLTVALMLFVAVTACAPVAAGTGTARVVPSVKFTRAFDLTNPVYVEVSIANGPSVAITLAAGVTKGPFVLEGVIPEKNYIIVAKASNDPRFTPENTQVLMVFVTKTQLTGVAEFTVNINSQTTPLAEAISLYCENTGYDLNDPAIEADLAAIIAAADPRAEAERLSTTSVSGTVVNINSVPVSGATVTTVGCINTASSTTDSAGNFTLLKVPIRCTRLEATCAPRYLPAQSDAIALQQNTPRTGVSMLLMPNPADARSDIHEAVRLMVDNSSGNLASYLAEGLNSFTYSSAGMATLDRATFITNMPGTYHEISWLDSDYTQTPAADGKAVTFTISIWTTRDAGTYLRSTYQAVGTAVFEGSLWRLKSLALSNEKKEPAAPALLATGGDGSVTLKWTASSDSLVTGYRLYRTTAAVAPVDDTKLIKTLGKSETTFTDADLSTGDYYYWIRAVENYDPGTGAVSVPGPLSAALLMHVFSSRTTVEQFMACAVAHDSAGMTALLSDGFQGYILPGNLTYSKSRAEFVNWMMDVFSLDGALPAKLWRVDSAAKVGSRLVVEASQIGHRVDTPPARNSRLTEDESWEVTNATGTPVITRFVLTAAPMVYPVTPPNFQCTNPGTVETDSHVDLAWDRPVDPELKGYRVLRSEADDYNASTAVWLQAEGTYLPPDQTTFTDGPLSVTGKTYFYWVIAYDNYEVNTMTEQNKNNCVQIGLPAEVKVAAQTFLDNTVNHNATGVRSSVATGFQASQIARVFTLDAYCTALSSVPPTLDLVSYQFMWYVREIVEGVETLRVTYTCSGTWDLMTIRRAEVEVVKVNGEWKVKTATFDDVAVQN